MFNFQSVQVDETRLRAILAKLSDEELAALEDDLDFCNFTGVPSVRVLRVLKDLTVLDRGWKRMLDREATPVVPGAF